MTTIASGLDVWVKTISREADQVNTYELRRVGGGPLPAFAAGAHVIVEMAAGLARSYSLVNPEGETHRYVIAVARDRASTGGSSYMHESVRVGSTLRVSMPRNNFRLDEAAARTVLIAGGIGITPLWCMAQRLHALGADWELHYATRSRSAAAFVEAMAALGQDAQRRLHLHFDDTSDGRFMDVEAILDGAPDAHVYCCGPTPMLKNFQSLTSARVPTTVHVEYFAAAAEAAAEGGYSVQLARAGKVLSIPAGSSILDQVLAQGIDVPYSCKEGTCGTCEVRVLEGVPDHRDVVLSAAERAANSKMMICCSGSLTERLVLDI